MRRIASLRKHTTHTARQPNRRIAVRRLLLLFVDLIAVFAVR